MEQKIKYIFTKIKDCESIVTAQDWFILLYNIQGVLGKLVHRHDIGISDRLWRFMDDFDNLEEFKSYYFDKIKTGEYKF